jgi:hypothetical protein
VVFTFNLLKQDPALDTTGVWAQLSSVSGSGDKVTMKFKAPNVPFAATVSQVPIVPQHLWSSVSKPDTYPNTKPVGTGPFTLKSFAPTQYTEAKNEKYWQADKIAPATVNFPVEQPVDQPAERLERQVRLVLQLPAERPADVRRPRSLAPLVLVPARRDDRYLPQPDQGAVQRRQLPQGDLALAEP